MVQRYGFFSPIPNFSETFLLRNRLHKCTFSQKYVVQHKKSCLNIAFCYSYSELGAEIGIHERWNCQCQSGRWAWAPADGATARRCGRLQSMQSVEPRKIMSLSKLFSRWISILSKKCVYLHAKNEDLSSHTLLPISVPTCHVTGLGEAVQNGKESNSLGYELE